MGHNHDHDHDHQNSPQVTSFIQKTQTTFDLIPRHFLFPPRPLLSSSMATSSRSTQPPPPPPPQPPLASQLNLEITIICSKHLKNVNWKNGDLKPYAIFWVDPDHKHTTKSDDSGNTKPVWNQRFLLPITSPLSDAFLSLEIFHSKTSETPKPFVGSLQVRLSSLPEPDNPNLIRIFDVLRPSGRPQGKIRLKLALKEQPLPHNNNHSIGVDFDYQTTPHPSYYYSSAPPFPYSTSRSASPAPPSPYNYSVGYFPGYYPTSGAGARSYGAPSAPVDYNTRPGLFPRSGLAVGAVAGVLGGIAVDEGFKYEEEKIADSVGENYFGTPKDECSVYRI